MIEYLPIAEVKLNPENPRTISDKNFLKLVKSIKEFPEMLELRPVIINDDNIALGGNMRLRACHEAGLKTIPVIRAKNLSDEKQKEFIIKDNLGFGEWDWQIINQDWDLGKLEDWGLEVMKFEKIDAVEDGFNEAPPDQHLTVLGDLYEIGEHRLLCGDSTNDDNYKRLMNGAMFDMILTDPPYNVDYVGKTKDGLRILNDKMNDELFYNFLFNFCSLAFSFTKAGGPWYIWHSDSYGHIFRKAMIDSGINIRQCLIWKKDSFVFGRQDYHWQHEPCLYGWKDGASHSWYSDRRQSTVLEYERPKKNAEHPTMKPVSLISYLINNSSKNDDIIGDPFLGSGTTMIAAHQLKRKCYGMEIDPKYCDVIIKRMIKFDPDISLKRNGNDCKSEFKI